MKEATRKRILCNPSEESLRRFCLGSEDTLDFLRHISLGDGNYLTRRVGVLHD